MGMYTPEMLLFWLGEAVTGCRRGSGSPACTGGIKLLDTADAPLSADCLYIAEEAALKQALAKGRVPAESTVILVSSAPHAFEDAALPPQLTLIESSLPLVELYNAVHTHIHDFWNWDDALREAVYTNAGPQALLDLAATQLHATLLLLNPGYKAIAAVYPPDIRDSISDELRENGYLSFGTIQDINRQIPLRAGPDREFVEYLSSVTGNYKIIRLIHYQGNLAARLCIVLDGPRPNPAYADMGAILAEYIAEYMFSKQGFDYGGSTDFGSLVSDIIEGRLTEPEELKQRLKQVSIDWKYFYHAAVVSFDEANRAPIPWNYVINQLQTIFPFSHAAVYRGQILLLLRKTIRASRVPISEDTLLPMLEQYHCRMGIGNCSEHISSLPTVYHQTRAGLRIGQVMDPDKRIFYYEDYSVYHIIELAANASRTNINSRNLLHLCNNEIVVLLMYDRKNGSDLVETLYTYLDHCCNSTEAAKALFIHRNTMLYKLKKIEGIIGCPLNNSMLQQRLRFSYHVLDFCRRYHHLDPLALQPIRREDFPQNRDAEED